MVSDAFVEIYCDTDGCKVIDRFNLTALAQRSWDERNLRRQAEREGWVFHGDGKTFCSDCITQAARMLRCRHFTGIQHETCAAGVNYSDVRDRLYGLPCIAGGRGICAKASRLTREESEAEDRDEV